MDTSTAADAACSFCGKGRGQVGHLIAGPSVWICDHCVRTLHHVIEQVTPTAKGESDEPLPGLDLMMTAIAEAQHAALQGHKEEARAAFGELWERIGPDGDPLHRVSLAHYMADAQDDAERELEWDQRALAAAEQLTDERAKTYHATLAVRGFFPSLHANLAADYERLGRPDEARHHLEQAKAALPDLPPGGYGDLVRATIDELTSRLRD